MSDENQKSEKGITFFSFVGSLISAWFGVSTQAKRERDFEQGKFSHFIIGGILFVIVFVMIVIGVVKLVLSSAGV